VSGSALAAVGLGLTVLSLVACGGTDAPESDAPTVGETPAVSAEACAGRCEKRMKSCNASSTQAVQICKTVCKGTVSQAAVDCLDDLSCAANQTVLQECATKNPPAPSDGSPPVE